MPRGRVGRHRDGRDGAAPDHERVDHGPARGAGDVRGRDAGEPAPLLDLRRQLRDRDPQAAARAHPGCRLDASGTSPSSSSSARASGAPNGPRSARARWCATEPTSVYTALHSPDHLLVVAAGGPAGGFGAVIPPWLGQQDQGRDRGHRRLRRLRAAEGLSGWRRFGDRDGRQTMTMRVLDPTNEAKAAGVQPAPRPSSLQGKTVGFISNGKEGTKRYFDAPRAPAARGAGRRRRGVAHEVELQRAGGRRHRRRDQAAGTPSFAGVGD